MFSGRRSARSGARVPPGAPFAAPASVKTGVEVSSGKIIEPPVSNLRQCCRFFQRKVRAVRGAAARVPTRKCKTLRLRQPPQHHFVETGSAQGFALSGLSGLPADLHICSQTPLRFAASLSSSGLPGASLPEIFQRSSGPAENVEFRLPNVGHTRPINRARKTAFAVATVLPESPVATRRRSTRLV